MGHKTVDSDMNNAKPLKFLSKSKTKLNCVLESSFWGTMRLYLECPVRRLFSNSLQDDEHPKHANNSRDGD